MGEQWYNHDDGHETSDADVRMALTQALDLGELASVSTAGAGTPATTLAAIEPVACPGDSVSGSLPAQDVDAAKAALAGNRSSPSSTPAPRAAPWRPPRSSRSSSGRPPAPR